MLFWSIYSSAILNIQVWSIDFLFMVRLVTKFPLLGIKYHMCHTSVMSLGHGHTLVFL